MKRIIVLISLLSMALLSVLAYDVGAYSSAGVSQKEYVITQITMPEINAVIIETVSADFKTSSYVFLASKTEKLQTFKTDAWRNPDYGPSIIIGNKLIRCNDPNSNSKLFAITDTKMFNNYNVNYSYGLRN